MRSDTNHAHRLVFLGHKHLVQHDFTPVVLRRGRLRRDPVPDLVRLAERAIKPVTGEPLRDGAGVAPPVARVRADCLAEKLLHRRRERVLRGQGQRRVGQVCGLQAARQWGYVVVLRRLELLRGELGHPEGVCGLGLRCSGVVEGGVAPGCCAVAGKFGPVALRALGVS